MIAASPPLRFLLLVLLAWTLVRGAVIGAEWLQASQDGTPVAVMAAKSPIAPARSAVTPATIVSAATFADQEVAPPGRGMAALRPADPLFLTGPSGGTQQFAQGAVMQPTAFADSSTYSEPPSVAAEPLSIAAVPALGTPSPSPGRWSGSAYLFVREDGGAQLAAGGVLGGSQAGARLLYRLNRDPARPLSLSGRVYLPLDDADAAEVAVGVDWQPIAAVPVRLLAERREAIGSRGRSDFALTAYGGFGPRRVAGPVHAEGYAQAGVVGVERGDAFVDGAVRAYVPLDDRDRIRVGAGIWGAAQPDAERVDVGPHLSVRILPGVRAAAEWRFGVAGDARPGSGPTLTIGADF